MFLKVHCVTNSKTKYKSISKQLGEIVYKNKNKNDNLYSLTGTIKVKSIKHMEQLFHNILIKNEMFIVSSIFYHTMAGNVYCIDIADNEVDFKKENCNENYNSYNND